MYLSTGDTLPIHSIAAEVRYLQEHRNCPPPDVVVVQCGEVEFSRLGTEEYDVHVAEMRVV